MKSVLYNFFWILCLTVALSSCRVREKIIYTQGAEDPGIYKNEFSYSQRIKPDDRLSIIVNSKEPELAAPFNMLLNQRSFSATSSSVSFGGGGGSPQLFWVNPKGDITYPTIGQLHVAGMTREDLQNYLQDYLKSNGFIQDPVVIVEFNGAKISVLGEVGSPGQYTLSGDRLTIFDAIAMAGDLTLYGERDKVRLYREGKDGEIKYVTLDLKDKNILTSEYFFLQQNDLIYVEPNSAKVSGREISSLYSFAISMISFALTLTTFIRSFK